MGSDGAAWPDYFKISYLKGALNVKNGRLPYYYESGSLKLPRFYKGNPINELTPLSI